MKMKLEELQKLATVGEYKAASDCVCTSGALLVCRAALAAAQEVEGI